MPPSPRLRTLATASLVAAVAVALRRWGRSRTGSASPDAFEVADRRVVAPRGREGTARDRGRGERVALDLDGLRGTGGFDPVVQYLTFIQSQREDGRHLLFVRHADLDAMADAEGEPTPAFLERLDQLGVVVSPN